MWRDRSRTCKLSRFAETSSGKPVNAEVVGQTSANNDPGTHNTGVSTRDCAAAGSSIKCDGNVGGVDTEILIDTGSVYSLISDDMWKRVYSTDKHYKTTKNIQ